jgi:hypothetical protein
MDDSNNIVTIMPQQPANKGEIVLYHPDVSLKLEVWLENETVWLSQAQIAELFQTTRNNVSMHITNIFKEGELERIMVCKKSLHTTQHGAIAGKTQVTSRNLFNLDVIISVGYRMSQTRTGRKSSLLRSSKRQSG